jgi:predicted SAM-dependent methyltransferase
MFNKLNLGCGYTWLAGYINQDKRDLPGVNSVFDLDAHPWPLPDEHFEEIMALDVFEHLADVVGAMDECYRILRARGILTVRGPLPDSPNLWVDVTHRRAFIEHSFDHFDWTTDYGRRYHYGNGSWHVLSERREDTNIIFDLVKV